VLLVTSHTFSFQVEYVVLNKTLTRSFRIAAETSGGGGVKFDPKPKRKSAAEGGSSAAAAAAAEIQQQMCDLAVKDAGASQKQSRQKQQKPAKPVLMYTSAFLDQKIAQQQQTVEVTSAFLFARFNAFLAHYTAYITRHSFPSVFLISASASHVDRWLGLVRRTRNTCMTSIFSPPFFQVAHACPL
jgi:hypothetical protein